MPEGIDYTTLAFPKRVRTKKAPKPLKRTPLPPRTKRIKQRSDKPHRKEIREKDKAFQRDIPPGAKCLVGKDCNGPLSKHHRIKRRKLKYRWDDRYALILCTKHHLFDIEVIGEAAFCKKHGISLPPLPDHS